MSVEPSTLERSALERKDREELTTIAQALGVKPPSRARKAEIVQLILELTGVEQAPAAGAPPTGDGGAPPAARARGRTTEGRKKEANVDDDADTGSSAPTAEAGQVADTAEPAPDGAAAQAAPADAPAADPGPEPPSEWELEFGGTTDVVDAPAAGTRSAAAGNGAPRGRQGDAKPGNGAPVASRGATRTGPGAGPANGNDRVGNDRGGNDRAQAPTRQDAAPGDARQGNGGQSNAGQSGPGNAGQSGPGNAGQSGNAGEGPSGQGNQSGQGQGTQVQTKPDGADAGEPGNRRRRRRGRRGKDEQAPTEEFSGQPVEVEGLLDLRDEGYGFLRVKGYLPSKDDIYVSVKQVRQFGLRKGDHITGASRPAMRNEKNPALLRIDKVNGVDPEQARKRRRFEDLTPLFPDDKLVLETAKDPTNMTARIVDLISPVGKGQRGLIVSPPKAGKTAIVKQIARSVETNNPEVKLMVLLVDERPEEVTDMRRWLRNESSEVVASTFDRPAEEHTQVSELTIERAKRLVEEGKDVCIILDGITRLARAYNLAAPATGRIMSGGVDSGALYPPKRFFGAARNIEEGGSLTILATALIETGSKMDEVIFEEFKGTGNMELRLDRRMADKRIFPAIDVNASSTRHEELLFERVQLQMVWKLSRVLSGLAESNGGLELLIDRMKTFRSNDEFLAEVA